MNLKASFEPYNLIFKRAAVTSRDIMNEKSTYFLKVTHENQSYIGECPFFKGLSADNQYFYQSKLTEVCEKINNKEDFLLDITQEYPSIQFGIEQIFRQIKTKTPNIFFNTPFTKGMEGIKINGLIWMGKIDFMKSQIQEKLNQNFDCIKIKIGSFWEEEYNILKKLRQEFSPNELEIRVDANGAFALSSVSKILDQLAQLNIHSIEQPIKANNIDLMARLCESTPIPIALDEELIGKFYFEQKQKLLSIIKPQYIILKPSLVGGWKGAKQWIDLAEKQNIGWWITSALESNIGLNAIAQWVSTLKTNIPQGLGTGGLFTNNIKSNLNLIQDKLYYSK